MLSAMAQEHERGLGSWHAEWETLPEIIRLCAGALHHLAETITRLEIDTARMRQNLEVTRGLIYAEAVAIALGKHLGKSAAHELVEAASRKAVADRKHLREVLASDPAVRAHLNVSDLGGLFEPSNYTGVAGKFIDRVLQAAREGREDR
jgi:3-carboxy-cis,cis-muconate cycloisomerase